MSKRLACWLCWLTAAALAAGAAAARGDEPELAPLFNGRDLSGWVNVNCAPSTFTVRDEMIVSTGIPTGVLRTQRRYENFVLELEWKHIKPGGNAGLFVWSDPITAVGVPFTRSIEVQILDGRTSENYTSHGDVFAIHGSVLTPHRPHPGGWMRCLPSEHRSKPAGEWNHYRVECNQGNLTLAVNGKVVSGGSGCRPKKGYICLESEGSECHFRNIRIRELPATKLEPTETAEEDRGFRSLYTGVDLSGWKNGAEQQASWNPKDWVLEYKGARGQKDAEQKDAALWTDREFKDFELICDWRLTGDAGDGGVYLRGSRAADVIIDRSAAVSGEVLAAVPRLLPPATSRVKADRPIGDWNRFVIRMQADRITVDLNGKRVAEDAQLPGVPERGPIGLKNGAGPIEFANLYVREL